MATDDAGFLVQLLEKHHAQLLDDLGIGRGDATESMSSASPGGGETETARRVREMTGNFRKDVALYGGGPLSRGGP